VEAVDLAKLPEDVAELKQLVGELSADYEKKLSEQQQAYRQLEERFLALSRTIFGRSSEKLSEEDHRQQRLFNEAEDGADEQSAEDGEEPPAVEVAAHSRKKRGRKKASEDLPCVDDRYDVSEEEKRCPCCGKQRPVIGEDISREKEIVPAKVFIRRRIRPVYGACSCKEFEESGVPAVLRAPMPERLLPGSDAGVSLLAYIIAAKFVDSLPFYRQERIFARLGLEISRTTMCNWAIAVGRRCAALIELMWRKIDSSPFQQMDETTVQVLKEPRRKPASRSYMWVNVGYVVDEDEDLKPLVLFHYHPSRAKEIVFSVLNGFQGYLQSDAFAAYLEVGRLPGIVHVGCFAHARRKFFEAARISKNGGAANQALAFIGSLYRTEKTLRNELAEKSITREQFQQRRMEAVTPVLEKMHSWLIKKDLQVPPKTALGKAVRYALNEWPRLVRYPDAWFLTPDNNMAENHLRPFVVGRKNWLFSDTPRGAHATAGLYSLVESARANGLEAYHYLRYIFEHLPTAKSEEELERLLPTNLKPEDLIPP
jgi:transposase